MAQVYIERSATYFYSDGVRHELVSFIPDVSIGSAYQQGIKTTGWIAYNPKMKKLAVNDKANCEFFVGLALRAL